jgi:hypothetical protein
LACKNNFIALICKGLGFFDILVEVSKLGIKVPFRRVAAAVKIKVVVIDDTKIKR